MMLQAKNKGLKTQPIKKERERAFSLRFYRYIPTLKHIKMKN